MSTRRYRLLVADDERLVAHNIAKNVERASDVFEIVCIAPDGEAALERARELLPHVVITDIKMPQMDGLELMRRLRDCLPQTRVVIVSGYDDFELVRMALKQNACDYLLKPINLGELTVTLKRIQTELDAQQRALSPESDAQRIADAVKEYLLANLAEAIDFSAMASDMGFSASYLTRVFKERNEGQTPIRYLQELRLNAARRMLRDSTLSVKEIAPRVGYADPFHFSKSFKQATGMSPVQYRAAYTGAAVPDGNTKEEDQ